MRTRFDPGYLVAAVLPLIGILPAFGAGVINTADGPLHVQRIYAMAQLLASGNLWPRWVPYFHLGYGYPLFNFYPPGVFQLGAWLVRLGITAPIAFNLVAAAAWVLGSVGMYRLAKHFLPARAAVLAVILWAYAPSRLFEVWDQGSLPQMMAAALIPWLFAGMVRLAENPRPRGMLGVALPLAGIILTHQPITFIVALYAAGLAGILVIFPIRAQHAAPLRKRLQKAVYLGESFALAGALTAIFLLPLALELRYVKSSEIASDTIPYLISNFLQPADVFMQPPAMDLTDLRYELHTTLGVAGGVLAVIGLAALVGRGVQSTSTSPPSPLPEVSGRGDKIMRTPCIASLHKPDFNKWLGLAAVLAVGLAFTIFMLLEESLPVWTTIPLFAQLRFPERFLRVGAVLIALAGGASLLALPRKWQNAGLAVGMIVVLASALPVIYPNQEFVEWDNLTAADEIRMELDAHVWGSTSYNEFNPVWGEKINYDEPETSEYIENPLRLTVHRLDMIRQWPDLQVEEVDDDTIRLTLTEPRMVRIRQYYFPGWAATLDGERVEIYPEDELGLIAVDVPAGEHVLELWYEGTPAQVVGTVASVVAVLFAGVLVVQPANVPTPYMTARRASVNGTDALYSVPTQLPSRVKFLPQHEAGIIVGAVVVFALVNTYLLAPYTRIFRHESPTDAPVYRQNAVNLSFGGVFELLGYTLESEKTAPGDVFDVTLFWRAEIEPIEREYRPIVQLVDAGASEAWAVSEPFFPGGGHTNVVGNYPLDRFASEVHKLRVTDDLAGDVYVGRVLVKMVDAQTGEALRLEDGRDFLLLDPLIRIQPTVRHSINTTLGGVIDLWCASVEEDRVEVYWHVRGTLPAGLTTFVHGLGADADAAPMVTGDAPLFGGLYPTERLPVGLVFKDVYHLPREAEIEQIAVGLYTGAGRLAGVQSDRVLLPLEVVECV